MGSPPSEAKVELGRQCDRHTHSSFCAYASSAAADTRRAEPNSFRWLHRRGSTRSHPEHGSQALQSRWYCTLCVWESRSLPEFFSKTPRRSQEPRGVAFSRLKTLSRRARRERREKLRFEKQNSAGSAS